MTLYSCSVSYLNSIIIVNLDVNDYHQHRSFNIVLIFSKISKVFIRFKHIARIHLFDK